MHEMNEIDIIEKIIRSIAHEVRNPLTTVKGYAQLLSHKTDPALIIKSHKMILEQTDRIDSIFTDLYEAFTVPSDVLTECSFTDIINTVVEGSSFKKNIILHVNNNLKTLVYSNRLRLCFEAIVNGFYWEYFNNITLSISFDQDVKYYLRFHFHNIVFDSIPEDYFYYPFQCKPFFIKGTELFRVYCIAHHSNWNFIFDKTQNEFTIIV